MKILIVANKFPFPPRDGGAIAKLNLIKGLSRHGVELTIAAINTSKHFFDKDKLPKEIAELGDFYDTYVNTDIKKGKAIKNIFFSKLPYNAERFINKDFENLLVSILQKHKFDIIQLEGHYVCPYIPIIRKHSKALISYRSHNIEHEIWQRTVLNTKNIWKKNYMKILAKRIKKMELDYINKYDMIVPITERDAKKYKEFGNNKHTHVCPTGINEENIAKAPTPFKHLSLFHLGGLDWPPNQQGIIWFLENCWEKISTDFPEIKFKVGGRNAPKSLIQKCKSYKNVEYLGEVEDATTFYNDNAIMIVPLLAGSGMRIKIVEGLAIGKLIVSTSIGAEGIFAESNKDIIIANTSDEFVTNIHKILKNPSLINDFGKNAINFVRENFNNYNITSQLIEFYEYNIANN